jgi:hypothetical protein
MVAAGAVTTHGGRSSAAEHWVVAPGVAGSNPVAHPHEINGLRRDDSIGEEGFLTVF